MKTKGLSENMTRTIESSVPRLVLSVYDIIKKHAAIMPNLLAAHVLTGCDTVSSFAGIGKVTVLKKLNVFTDELKLGQLSMPFQEIFKPCLQFTRLL